MHDHPNMRFRRQRRTESGLSLVELLMAIMILGVISSLAMMSLGSGVSDEAETQRDKRNAQTIANIASMASAAGADYFVEGDEEASVQKLRDGCTPTNGIFKGRLFKLPALTDDQIQRTLRFLKLNTTDLMYDSSGTN